MSKKVVIIGGVAGGASAAARLRRLDETAEIVVFERGEYVSFASCGLPYYIGGEITEKSALTLQTPQSFRARFNVDVRNFSEVTSINRNEKTVSVKNLSTGESYSESYDKLILAMGAEPIKPATDSPKVFTLRNINDTYRIKDFVERAGKKTAAVVGGGFIGVEMAENLHKAELSVTIFELSEQLLPPMDVDTAAEIKTFLKHKGIAVKLGTGFDFSKDESDFDIIIFAVGVRPETAIAKAAGLDVTERGHIVTNDEMLTSDGDIYAVGDAAQVRDFVTGEKTAIPLAGPANRQGRIAADNICGLKSSYTGTQGSSIIKIFEMTAASTGINEKTAKRLGLDYDKSFTYSPDHASYYPGAMNMSVKIIFEKLTGKLLGAQIVGFSGVDKRCDVLATAIRFGATAVDLTRLELCYAPPFSSAKDPVNMAGFVIENIVTGKLKCFHWHDVAALPRDGSVVLLDVRTPSEYARGGIGGFTNIPLDSLRGRLGEIPVGKKVYVHCQSGMRSYIACRILTQNGFDCYNLSGGYRLWSAVVVN